MFSFYSLDLNSSRRMQIPRAGAGLHRSVRRQRRVLALVLLLGFPMAAQLPGVPIQMPVPGGRVHPRPEDPADSGGIDLRMEAKRNAELNVMRQKSMVSDADKLLRLAQELNADADAGGAIMSPAERMHKATEIEKLARNVKEKMTYAIGEPPEMGGPFAAWQR